MRCGHVDRKGRACLRGFHFDPLHVYRLIPRVGLRKKRTAQAERTFRRELTERSDGFCEATERLIDNHRDGFDLARAVCGTGIHHAGIDPHHLYPEDRGRNVHDPARGLLLCRAAHDWIHDNYARAQQLGLIRPARASSFGSWGSE